THYDFFLLSCFLSLLFRPAHISPLFPYTTLFRSPYCSERPTRWMVYSKLLDGILRSAKTAKRVSIRPQVTPENEKYHANSWLMRSEEHTSELQSRFDLVCRLLLEKKKVKQTKEIY